MIEALIVTGPIATGWPLEYESMPIEQLTEVANAAHHHAENAAQAVVGWTRHALQWAFMAGEALIEAKGRMKHGEWLPWIESEFEGAKTTAQNYMRLARRRPELEANAQQVAHLGIREALGLLAELEPNGRRAQALAADNSSESFEWYTPGQYVAAARRTMGGIDLDPASCAAANKTVRARRFYAIEDDGRLQEWSGRILLNPPYGQDEDNKSRVAAWSRLFDERFRAGDFTQGVLVVGAKTAERWFARLWDYPICFTDHRVRYLRPDGQPGKQPPSHGSAFVYAGKRVSQFAEAFREFGRIVIPEPDQLVGRVV